MYCYGLAYHVCNRILHTVPYSVHVRRTICPVHSLTCVVSLHDSYSGGLLSNPRSTTVIQLLDGLIQMVSIQHPHKMDLIICCRSAHTKIVLSQELGWMWWNPPTGHKPGTIRTFIAVKLGQAGSVLALSVCLFVCLTAHSVAPEGLVVRQRLGVSVECIK